MGFVAQDVLEALPEAVSEMHGDRYLGVDYGAIVPVLVDALKDTDRKIDANQRQVEAAIDAAIEAKLDAKLAAKAGTTLGAKSEGGAQDSLGTQAVSDKSSGLAVAVAAELAELRRLLSGLAAENAKIRKELTELRGGGARV